LYLLQAIFQSFLILLYLAGIFRILHVAKSASRYSRTKEAVAMGMKKN